MRWGTHRAHDCMRAACALHPAYPAHDLARSRTICTHLAHTSHAPAPLLQAHGFLCDTGHFRGLMPTLDPRQLLRAPPIPNPAAGWSARLPSPPLSDFVETSSLEVNYMGWAVKSELAGSGGAATEVSDPDATTRGGEESPPKEHAPGALAKGLRDFERVS
jgi:hypothetical protein